MTKQRIINGLVPKKSEDASIPLIATCTHTKEQMLVQAKIVKENLNLLDMALKKTIESVAKEQKLAVVAEAVTCQDYIPINEELINHLIEDPLRPLSLGKYNEMLSSGTYLSCDREEETLKIDLQVEMMMSTRRMMIKFLQHLQDNLKSKYLFGSVLQFFKFLTDEPSKLVKFVQLY